MRQSPQQGSALEIESLPDGIRVTLDSMDNWDRFINEATGTVMVVHSDMPSEQWTQKWTLHQTAPGRYETKIPLPETSQSVYHLQTELRLGDRVLENQSRSVMTRYSDELRIRPTNEALLRQLAELTGGSYDIAADDIIHWQAQRTVRQALPLWSWLLTLAAVLFVFDVLLRRVEIRL
jgi:hypothetical protein